MDVVKIPPVPHRPVLRSLFLPSALHHQPAVVGALELWRAVESFMVADLPLVIQSDAERRLRSCVTAGGPILLGETHGASENPLAIPSLIPSTPGDLPL